jgi:hypothetical protein
VPEVVWQDSEDEEREEDGENGDWEHEEDQRMTPWIRK